MIRFAAAPLAATLALGLAACAINPVTGSREFSLMGEVQEARMGEQAYPVYTQMSEGLYPDPALQAYVAGVGQRLAALGHRPELAYEFNVVNASEINAYALPGGKISITRGLLAKMTNEAQLAAVLGHEIGHVTARHAAAGYTRQVLAGVLTTVGMVALESADVRGGELLAQGGMLASTLVLQKYGRDQERQSDELGMEYLTLAGYHPEGLVQTMEILHRSHEKEPSAVETLFRSHPLTSERIETGRRLAAAQPADLKRPENLREEAFRAATAGLRATEEAYAAMDKGKAALAKGKTEEALVLLAEATRLAPDHALPWTFRAAAEAKAKKLPEGATSAEKAAALDPGLFRARFVAGVLAFEEKRYPGSLAHLEAADRLVPDQPQVTFFRGRNLDAQGRREDAARAYAAVLQKVRKGPMAEHSYRRLVEWGYVRRQ